MYESRGDPKWKQKYVVMDASFDVTLMFGNPGFIGKL